MESLAALLSLLPPPKLLPVLDTARHLALLRERLVSGPGPAAVKEGGSRSETGALVKRTVDMVADPTLGRVSTEQTIARASQPSDRIVYASAEDSRGEDPVLRPDAFPRPSPEEIAVEMEETRKALEALLHTKITCRQPTTSRAAAIVGQSRDQLIEYQSDSGTRRNILITSNIQRDPLSPPRFKHKRAPAPPPSPPPPVLHSPPRRLTATQYAAWKIPPCVSSWKNPKGYTVPLDKRLASDGRALLEHVVSERFAALSESLYVAEAQAREELGLRAQIAEKGADEHRMRHEEAMSELLSANKGLVSNRNRSGVGRPSQASSSIGEAEETMFDPRLFGRSEGVASALGADDEAYNLYDRPLAGARSILAHPTALVTGSTFVSAGPDAGDDVVAGSGKKRADRREEEYARLASRDYSQSLQFVSAANAGAGHAVADEVGSNETRDEKDPFGLDAFLSAAKGYSSSK